MNSKEQKEQKEQSNQSNKMKTLLLSIIITMVLLPCKYISAQDYRPMAADSVRWIVRQYDVEPWFNSTLYEYYALGDTLVNDTCIKKSINEH